MVTLSNRCHWEMVTLSNPCHSKQVTPCIGPILGTQNWLLLVVDRITCFEQQGLDRVTISQWQVLDTVTISQWQLLDRVTRFQWPLVPGFWTKAFFEAEILICQAWDNVESDPGPSFHHICWDSSRGDNPFKALPPTLFFVCKCWWIPGESKEEPD